MPATLPHTFADGPGNTASGVEVMDNLNAVNAGVFMATVTSLPSSPVNGQDCYILADATNGVVWHFKYRAASASGFKWEFVGGGSLYSEVLTLESTASGTFVDLTTVGPQVTVPLAGDYDVEFSVIANNTTAGAVNQIAPKFGAAAAASNDRAQANIAAANQGLSASAIIRRQLAAATTVKLQYLVGSGTGSFSLRELKVRPVRVG